MALSWGRRRYCMQEHWPLYTGVGGEYPERSGKGPNLCTPAEQRTTMNNNNNQSKSTLLRQSRARLFHIVKFWSCPCNHPAASFFVKFDARKPAHYAVKCSHLLHRSPNWRTTFLPSCFANVGCEVEAGVSKVCSAFYHLQEPEESQPQRRQKSLRYKGTEEVRSMYVHSIPSGHLAMHQP